MRPNAKMKTFTNVNEGKSKACVAFCLNYYLVSYAKSDLEKIGSSTNETHQTNRSIPLGSKALLITVLKLAIRRHKAKLLIV